MCTPAPYSGHVSAHPDRSVDWPQVRLHVVTGKGGTGKSTVAAALALALATSGRNVLLCEVEGRQGIARMFDVDPLPYEETRIAKGAPDATGRAGQVNALHIDPESALLEYLAMYYKLGRAGKALDRFGVIDFATTIAPGVRDVLLTGKVYEAVQRPRGARTKDQITYDAVVLDAPPTGRICQFLGVNSELAGLAKVGPVKSQADKVMELLRSPRTAVHLVTILEEMPVQETSDGIAQLHEAGLPVGGVVVNLVRPQALGPGALAPRARRLGRPDRRRLRPHPRDGRRRRRAGRLAARRGPRPRRTPSARGRAARARRGGGRCRPTSCRASPAASTSARCSRWRSCCAHRGWHETRPRQCWTSTRSSTTASTEIIVCCGSGGVGKTTTSAALALRAAERGRKVVVLTIDPARRLAQSMGIEQLDNTPRPVADVDAAAGGSLDAMMLDMKRTFDEVVESQASAGEGRGRSCENPFYVALSSSFAGTQEYMAMEKLGQLHRQALEDGSHDLIVVDTPPSRSALDFLDAPERLSSFLDGRFIRLLLAPARGPARLMTAGLSVVTNALTKVARRPGAARHADLRRARSTPSSAASASARDQTFALLQADGTAFVVVAAPEPDALREAAYFVDRLTDDDMPLAGLVVNRAQPPARRRCPPRRRSPPPTGCAPRDSSSLTAGLLQLHADRVAHHRARAAPARALRRLAPAGAHGGGAGDARRRARPRRPAHDRREPGAPGLNDLSRSPVTR